MRVPRDVGRYSSAEFAAAQFEQIAEDIRKRKDVAPLVRWSIELKFWNPSWAEEEKASAKRPKR